MARMQDPDGMPLPPRNAPIPTPDEIAERRDQIQKRWSERVRIKRKVGRHEPWTPPLITGEQVQLAMQHLLDDES